MIVAKCVNVNTNPYNIYPELELGKEYVVKSIEVGRFHSDVKIKGSTKRYNSICFEYYESGEKINIYGDKRFWRIR